MLERSWEQEQKDWKDNYKSWVAWNEKTQNPSIKLVITRQVIWEIVNGERKRVRTERKVTLETV